MKAHVKGMKMAVDSHRDQTKRNPPTVGFIGAGKVGFSLGKYFQSFRIPLSGYFSKNPQDAQEAATFTEAHCFTNVADLVKESDMIFLTVPDQAIQSCFESLRPDLMQNKIFCHCSGALSSQDAFPGILELESSGGSMHPLFAINDRFRSYKQLDNAFFCIEGDAEALKAITHLLEITGNPHQTIDSRAKTLYHCAAAIASNHVVALAHKSIELLQDCGFTQEEALVALSPILVGNMQHIAQVGPTEALTGPIERGDADTIKKHLDALPNQNDKRLYALISQLLVDIAQEKHPERNYQSISDTINTIEGNVTRARSL